MILHRTHLTVVRKRSDHVTYPASRYYNRRTIQQGRYLNEIMVPDPSARIVLGHLAYICLQRLFTKDVAPLQNRQVHARTGNR